MEEGVSLTICQFPIAITGEQLIDMRRFAKILCVQMQGLQPCLWAVVDRDAHTEQRTIRTLGTGQPFDEEPGVYVGTYQTGPLVFHVFDGGPVT